MSPRTLCAKIGPSGDGCDSHPRNPVGFRTALLCPGPKDDKFRRLETVISFAAPVRPGSGDDHLTTDHWRATTAVAAGRAVYPNQFQGHAAADVY